MPRPCSECHKNKIKDEEEDWKTVCKGCYINKIKNMKKCTICHKPNIKLESSKDICNNCYSESEFTKQCINYNECQNNIIGEDNMWKDKCLKCYKIEKQNKDNSTS